MTLGMFLLLTVVGFLWLCVRIVKAGHGKLLFVLLWSCFGWMPAVAAGSDDRQRAQLLLGLWLAMYLVPFLLWYNRRRASSTRPPLHEPQTLEELKPIVNEHGKQIYP